MKRIFVSMGLAAIGASTLSAYADDSTGLDVSRPWSVSLNLRGFYSDNIDTAPNGRSGFGFDINPSARLHLSSPQTDFTAGYSYDATFYDKPPAGNGGDHFDHTHTFDFNLQHQFSERYSITINDAFVIGQSPDQLHSVGSSGVLQRVSGANIHNVGSINFDAQITHLFGIELGYENSWTDYESEKFGFTTFLSSITPSLSGANDRIDQTVHLDTHWNITPTTTFIVGYRFSVTEYTGDQPVQAINPLIPIFPNTSKNNLYFSDVRDSHSHSGYIGVNHEFLPNLTGSLKVGATYSESYNDPNGSTSVSPYVSLNANYSYGPESYAQLGFTHDRSSNDRIGGSGTAVVQDSETSVVFALLHHRITPKFFATLSATFQDSVINAPGLALDGNEDNYYLVALDFEYRFTHHFAMHAGYNYDRLDAGVSGLSYDKNTIYFGGTLSY